MTKTVAFGTLELDRAEVEKLRVSVLSMVDGVAKVADGLARFGEEESAKAYAKEAEAYGVILFKIENVLAGMRER